MFDSDGGIAALNRLTISALAERYALDLFLLAESESKVDQRYVSNEFPVHARAFSGRKLTFVLSAWRAILSGEYDLILIDHVNLAAALAPLRWLGLAEYTVWLCGVEVFPPRPDFEGKLGLKNASRRLAISEFTRRSVGERFPDLEIKVCDLALDPVRHAPPVPQDEPLKGVELVAIDGSRLRLGRRVLLHVGRMATFERFKGQQVLIDAFPLVYQKYPDVQLVLAGQGDDYERLKARALSLPAELHDSVFMPGYVQDELLERLYRLCYLFTMPSIGEGFGLVYLEAMSRGKPCLGARSDATPFVIREGETGILVDDPRSPEDVSDAITWFLEHPDKAEAMGRAGYELVNSYYLFPHFKERFWRAISGAPAAVLHEASPRGGGGDAASITS